MDATKIALVQESWYRAVSNADAVAETFYERLFLIDPEMRGLFGDNLSKQRKMFVGMLGRAVLGLDEFDAIAPDLDRLGRRHGGYGVVVDDYEVVCHALIEALEHNLGDFFTPEVEQAWLEALEKICVRMIDAADSDTDSHGDAAA